MPVQDSIIQVVTARGHTLSMTTPLRKSILRLSSLRYHWLRFSPALELRFASEETAFRSRRQWLEGLFGIGMYAAFAVASRTLAPHGRLLGFDWRLMVILPLALCVNTAMLLELPLWLREASIVLVSCSAGTVEIYCPSTWQGHNEACAQLAILAVAVFTSTVMRLRGRYVAVAFGWALCAECFEVLSHPQTDALGFVPAYAMTLSVCVLLLVANYSQEREARLAFLMHAEKEDLVGSLAQSNEELAAVALKDGLTGLPNRTALTAYLASCWENAVGSQAVCSIIMVDIDHFKSLNDEHGHLYGDRVLKRVARLLSEALRGEDDLIARFGGEEFVVILPHTPGNLACYVAERLRGLVELAGLPAVRTGDPGLQNKRATISCGVASAHPAFYPDPYTLIQAADEALYRAKQEGRNCVRVNAGAEILPVPDTLG